MSMQLIASKGWENRFKDLTSMFARVEHTNKAWEDLSDGTRISPREIAFRGKSVDDVLMMLYMAIIKYIWIHTDYSLPDGYDFGDTQKIGGSVHLKNYAFVWRITPDLMYTNKDCDTEGKGYYSSYCRFFIYKKELTIKGGYVTNE